MRSQGIHKNGLQHNWLGLGIRFNFPGRVDKEDLFQCTHTPRLSNNHSQLSHPVGQDNVLQYVTERQGDGLGGICRFSKSAQPRLPILALCRRQELVMVRQYSRPWQRVYISNTYIPLNISLCLRNLFDHSHRESIEGERSMNIEVLMNSSVTLKATQSTPRWAEVTRNHDDIEFLKRPTSSTSHLHGVRCGHGESGRIDYHSRTMGFCSVGIRNICPSSFYLLMR